MRKLSSEKTRRAPAKRRQKVVAVLRNKGALFVADAAELARRQKEMLDRFEALARIDIQRNQIIVAAR